MLAVLGQILHLCLFWFVLYLIFSFLGTLIVVPDVGSIQTPGARAESSSKHKGGEGSEGLRGLKSLGVRDLRHRMAFLACNVISCNMKLGEQAPDSSEEVFKRSKNCYFFGEIFF